MKGFPWMDEPILNYSLNLQLLSALQSVKKSCKKALKTLNTSPAQHQTGATVKDQLVNIVLQFTEQIVNAVLKIV